MLDLYALFRSYRSRRLRFASPSTINQFTVSIGNFFSYLGKRPTVMHLRSETVLSAMEWKLNAGCAPATVNKFRANILALWRFALEENLTRARPDVQKVDEPDEIPVIWSASQLRALYDTLQTIPGTYAGAPARAFWLALHGVLWDTGERIGAVLQTRTSDVDLVQRIIVFRGATRKHKKRDRMHPLHPTTCDFLRQIMNGDRVFPVRYHALRLSYRRILVAAGMPRDRKHLFQCMRRTTGSFFEAAGGNATELLDHSSRSITVRYYLNPSLQPMTGPALMQFRPDGA